MRSPRRTGRLDRASALRVGLIAIHEDRLRQEPGDAHAHAERDFLSSLGGLTYRQLLTELAVRQVQRMYQWSSDLADVCQQLHGIDTTDVGSVDDLLVRVRAHPDPSDLLPQLPRASRSLYGYAVWLRRGKGPNAFVELERSGEVRRLLHVDR